jgi:predicted transcriptional regulator
MFVDKILEDVFPGETAAARLQQVGLFTLVYVYEHDPEPLTAARLAALTGLSPSQVHKQLKKLITLELIGRKQVLNRQGRGFAWQLSIKHSPRSRKLLAMIEKGPPGKRPQ